MTTYHNTPVKNCRTCAHCDQAPQEGLLRCRLAGSEWCSIIRQYYPHKCQWQAIPLPIPKPPRPGLLQRIVRFFWNKDA